MNLHAKKSYNNAFPEATARGVVFSFEGNLKDLCFSDFLKILIGN